MILQRDHWKRKPDFTKNNMFLDHHLQSTNQIRGTGLQFLCTSVLFTYHPGTCRTWQNHGDRYITECIFLTKYLRAVLLKHDLEPRTCDVLRIYLLEVKRQVGWLIFICWYRLLFPISGDKNV